MIHPLKLSCMTALTGLLITQFGLIFYPEVVMAWYWVTLLTLPLLIPLQGFVKDRLYTYKWVGFLALLYFCIGVSELVSNPEMRIYAYLTTLFSVLLFLSSIYYTRYLRLKQ